MIIGLVPVGGKGTRLGLPFSKELLPQAGRTSYQPVIQHVTDKMIEAGAEKIVFVHGKKYKEDIVRYYQQYEHICQENEGFAKVLNDLWKRGINKEDKILFGLPDTLFQDNPFQEMLLKPGIVCGLFTTSADSRVDRLKPDGKFDVKASENLSNSELFWGIIKFDGLDIERIISDKILDKTDEIGVILNQYPFGCVRGGEFVDLGTWLSLTRYWSTYRPPI